MVRKTCERQDAVPMCHRLPRAQPRNLRAPKSNSVLKLSSPEIQKEDGTIKPSEYNAMSSIVHYGLVERSQPPAQVYSRGPKIDFLFKSAGVGRRNGAIELPAVSIKITMTEVYESLAFAEPDADSPHPTTLPSW